MGHPLRKASRASNVRVSLLRQIGSGEQGYSLVSVLVALGIAATLAISSYQQAVMQSRLVVQSKVRGTVIETVNNIKQILGNADACKKTFGGYRAGDSGIPIIYSSRILDMTATTANWVTQPMYFRGSSSIIGNSIYLNEVSLKGDLAPLNTGEMTAVFDFRGRYGNASSPEIGFSREVTINAKLDHLGRITSCQTSQYTSLDRGNVCKDPLAACTDSLNYCVGQMYLSSIAGCVCAGTKVCTTPSPTPSSSPTPAPSPTVSPSPTPSPTPSPGNIMVLARLYNGLSSIDFDYQFNAIGSLHYAVYEGDKGSLTPADIKVAAGSPIAADLVARGTIAVGTPGVTQSLNVPGLPDGKLYSFYAVAENSSLVLDSVNKYYTKVIPKKLSMQEIAAGGGQPLIRYMVYYPVGYYDDSNPAPVMYFWHGFGEVSSDPANGPGAFSAMNHLIPALSIIAGSELPMAMIAPQCNIILSDCWNYQPGWYNRVFDNTKGAYRFDPKRMYSSGNSTGSLAAYGIALERPAEVSAVVTFMSVGHPWSPPYIAQTCTAFRDNGIALWAFHNSNDSWQPTTSTTNMQTNINGCGAVPRPPKVTLFTGAVWPANPDGVNPYDNSHHNAASYVVGSPYYHYPTGVTMPFATPLEPLFVTELAAAAVAAGKPLSTIWDWLLLHSKP